MLLLKQLSDTQVLVKNTYHNKRSNKNIVYEEVIHTKTYVEELSKKRKLLFALRKRDEEAQLRHVHETKYGFCPHCFMQIPLSGVCDCGYNAK